ncbi:MAG: ArsC family reductase [Burkholderiales bacterium]|nr:ArsC family reductase [Burkholderiales bacterium]
MAVTLYGIPTCTTVRRARAWLNAQGVEHRFHDFRKDGVPEAGLDRWLTQLPWQTLLNRRGTSWRALPEALRAGVVDAASARALMLAHPTTIKRPVVDWGDGQISVGFDEADWTQAKAQLR